MAYKKKHEAHVEADEPAIVHQAKSEPAAVNVTWLGEGEDGPNVNTWRGITFPKGEAVAVTNQKMIEKAKGNRFYSVQGHHKD